MNSNEQRSQDNTRIENCGRCDSCRNEKTEKKINDTTKKTVKFKEDKKPSTTDLTGCVYIPTKEDVKE